ncbi:MAG: PocR ligand-binding domain-containing protein [Sandaracinus sp.]|nr:PocR ligand-binding domain-containing protein [Sandaracinus sp.]
MNDAAPTLGIDLAMGDVAGLDEVVDREALRDVCRSFHELFGINVRVFSGSGALLADAHEETSIHAYLRTLTGGRRALSESLDAIIRATPDQPTQMEEISGAIYDVVPLVYQGRRVGRFVLGPYLPAELKEVPRALLKVDPALDREKIRQALATMPRVKKATSERIVAHLRGILDLLVFSSHRAHLTSEMHVVSVRESYRELAEKTARLQAAYDRLRELDKLKSNFLATVSHELRTPLTSIIGYSEMLEAGIAGPLGEEQLDFVQTIHAKGEQLLALISSLLDLSKLEQGVLRIEPELLDAREILVDMAKTFEPSARKKQVELVVDAAANLPRIAADPVRIKQILSNLAENAIKFTPQGGKVFFAATETDLDDEEGGGLGAVLLAAPRRAVAFSVRDTGIGMPREELPKIFDAFYQIDGSSTREHGGTGLGLSIVKRLVDAHEGTIRVDSEIGHGTVFTVTIPEAEND